MKGLLPKYSVLLIFFSLSGCGGCCPDGEQLIDTYLLSEFEKSLVPYRSFVEISYENEKGETVVANTQPRDLEIKEDQPGPESCEYWEFETVHNYINFFSLGFSIELEMATFDGVTSFNMSYVEPGNTPATEFLTGLFNFSEDDSETLNFMDTEIQDVFVLENQDSQGVVESIYYSSKGNGIELIKLSNNRYLKRK